MGILGGQVAWRRLAAWGGTCYQRPAQRPGASWFVNEVALGFPRPVLGDRLTVGLQTLTLPV
jgi:hypothetical protein